MLKIQNKNHMKSVNSNLLEGVWQYPFHPHYKLSYPCQFHEHRQAYMHLSTL